jgi:hypothetical protein
MSFSAAVTGSADSVQRHGPPNNVTACDLKTAGWHNTPSKALHIFYLITAVDNPFQGLKLIQPSSTTITTSTCST